MKKLLLAILIIVMLTGTALGENLWTVFPYEGLVSEAGIHFNRDAFEEIMASQIKQSGDGAAAEDMTAQLEAVSGLLAIMDSMGLRYAYGRDRVQAAVSLGGEPLMSVDLGLDEEKLMLASSLIPEHILVLGYEEMLERMGLGASAKGIAELFESGRIQQLPQLLLPYGDKTVQWAKALPFESAAEGKIHSESYAGHLKVQTWRITGREMADLAELLLDVFASDDEAQKTVLSLDPALSQAELMDWCDQMRKVRSAETVEETLVFELALNEKEVPVGASLQILRAGSEAFALSLGCKEDIWCLETRFPASDAQTMYIVGRLLPNDISPKAMVMDVLVRCYLEAPGMTVSQLTKECRALVGYEFAYDVTLSRNGRLRFQEDLLMTQSFGGGTRVTMSGGGKWNEEEADINLTANTYMEGLGTAKPMYSMQMHMYSQPVPSLETESKSFVSIFRLMEEEELQQELMLSMENAARQMLLTLYKNIPQEVIKPIIDMALASAGQ